MNVPHYATQKERPATELGAKLAVAARGAARREHGGGATMTNSRAAASRHFQPRRGNSRRHVGNVLPRERFTSDDTAKGQAEVLQAKFGRLKSPAKEMALETGQSERACRNQIAGVNCMNLADFFNACQAIPELRAWGAAMMGLEANLDPCFGPELAKALPTILLRIEQGGITVSEDKS